MNAPLPVWHEDVACTVCGCVCDDLRIAVEAGRIVQTHNACRLAEAWYAEQNRVVGEPAVLIRDAEASRSSAVLAAAEILRNAKSPLIFGLSRSSTHAQRAAVELADRLQATIDTTASTGHAPSILALQQVGESTCTLGEVKQRADLVVFWGTDPETTHPRHIERYAPPRPGRTLIVVDHERTATAERVDEFVQIPERNDWLALEQLRLLLKGVQPSLPVPASLAALTETLKSARFGIIFFGVRLTRGAHAHKTIESLLLLVRELNQTGRFYARRMRRFGDVAGADSVLAWQTGYPFGVNFARGYPRYNPGEFTGPDLLARREVDAALIVGADTVQDFPADAARQLQSIPTILVSAEPPYGFRPTIHFRTATYGIHRPGTAYRMDEVPIPLRTVLDSNLPSDDEILTEILKALNPS